MTTRFHTAMYVLAKIVLVIAMSGGWTYAGSDICCASGETCVVSVDAAAHCGMMLDTAQAEHGNELQETCIMTGSVNHELCKLATNTYTFPEESRPVMVSVHSPAPLQPMISGLTVEQQTRKPVPARSTFISPHLLQNATSVIRI